MVANQCFRFGHIGSNLVEVFNVQKTFDKYPEVVTRPTVSHTPETPVTGLGVYSVDMVEYGGYTSGLCWIFVSDQACLNSTEGRVPPAVCGVKVTHVSWIFLL